MTLLHVAVAVIVDPQGRILLAQRPHASHQGGLWEFPGGKLEPGESMGQALRREIHEELGVCVQAHRPLIRIRHDYPDRSVLLDVHRVDRFSGKPAGREGQPLTWVAPEALDDYPMPAADKPIVAALRLPDRLMITGEDAGDPAAFIRRLQSAIDGGPRLVQLRAPQLDAQRYHSLAAQVVELCRALRVQVVLNADPELAADLDADGVHLNRHRLKSLRERPLEKGKWVSAACHDLAELQQAEEIGADFALISPVLPTASHPRAEPIGWQGFRRLAARARIPVYALGGMQSHMIEEAQRNGGQGVAAIRGFWPRA